MKYLSYLMAADNVRGSDLETLDIEIIEKDSDGDRSIKIPENSLDAYLNLVRLGLNPGFWNEVIGEKEIIFIFKFKDGNIKEYRLSLDSEKEISQLCSQFNGDPLEKTSNVYKYISNNKFYHDFMTEHYFDMINR